MNCSAKNNPSTDPTMPKRMKSMQAARARRQNPAIGDRGVAGGVVGASGCGGGPVFSIGADGESLRGFPEIEKKMRSLASSYPDLCNPDGPCFIELPRL